MTDGIKGTWEFPTRGRSVVSFVEADEVQVDELTASELALVERVIKGCQVGPAAFRLA